MAYYFNINDIFLSAPKVSSYLFADVTCVFYTNKNLKQLENVMNNVLDIRNWMKPTSRHVILNNQNQYYSPLKRISNN